jgi:hypothetical protein
LSALREAITAMRTALEQSPLPSTLKRRTSLADHPQIAGAADRASGRIE